MSKRFLKTHKQIRQGLDHSDTSHLVPTWQDIEVLQALDTALAPLAELTDLLSGDQYITISCVKPLLHWIGFGSQWHFSPRPNLARHWGSAGVRRSSSSVGELTDLLSGDQYITISCVKPLLHWIGKNELATKSGNLPMTKKLRWKQQNCIAAIFSEVFSSMYSQQQHPQQ